MPNIDPKIDWSKAVPLWVKEKGCCWVGNEQCKSPVVIVIAKELGYCGRHGRQMLKAMSRSRRQRCRNKS